MNSHKHEVFTLQGDISDLRAKNHALEEFGRLKDSMTNRIAELEHLLN